MSDDKMTCPNCGDECWREHADVGVGIIYGPWGCGSCGWSESDEYNLLIQDPGPDERGGYIDQWGGYHPKGSSLSLAYRLADEHRAHETGASPVRDTPSEVSND
jgi:ribosomal protein S27AE